MNLPALALAHLLHRAMIERLIFDDDIKFGEPNDSLLIIGNCLNQRPTRAPDNNQPERDLCLGVVVADFRKIADALAGQPLVVVITDCVKQFAHELRREVNATDHYAGNFWPIELMINPREGNRKLVIGVRNVREVGVVTCHLLRREVNIELPIR